MTRIGVSLSKQTMLERVCTTKQTNRKLSAVTIFPFQNGLHYTDESKNRTSEMTPKHAET